MPTLKHRPLVTLVAHFVLSTDCETPEDDGNLQSVPRFDFLIKRGLKSVTFSRSFFSE